MQLAETMQRAAACEITQEIPPSSGLHALQHFLNFLPLPHGHGSFLPVLGVALLIWDELEVAVACIVPFARFWLSSRKQAHEPISATVSSIRRQWGLSASLARTRSFPIAKSRFTSSKPM